jgi:hypothetical protein
VGGFLWTQQRNVGFRTVLVVLELSDGVVTEDSAQCNWLITSILLNEYF